MPLQNYQYDTIMREYSKTQSQNRRILEERTQEIYKKIPRIHEIDEEVATLSAKKARALLSGESSGLEDLKAAISLLSQERNALLVCNSYPEDYLELPYKCPVCQDTGYVGSQKCTCFKKAEIELLYTQSNLKEILKKENFDHFSFDYYSDTMKNEATGLTERETARRAYDIARGFVRNFDSSFENLFLYGDTGVGKTFLSHCIAHDLLESAHCVMYFSAFDLFELLADSKFSRDKTEGQEQACQKIKGAVLVAGNEEVGTGLLTRKLQIDLILSGNFFDQLRLEYLQAAAQTDNHAASHCVTGLLEQAVGCFEGQQPVDFANVAVFFRIALIHIQYQGLEQIHLAGIPEMVALAVVRGVLDDDIYKKLGH